MSDQIETHQIMGHALEVAGAKRVAHTLGLSLGHTYKLARHPMDASDPEGTGVRNDLDRIEALADLLASRPGGAAVLVEMREWFDGLFERALGTRPSAGLTPERMASEASRTLTEFGQFIAECRPGAYDPERLVREGAEAVAAIESLMRAAAMGGGR